MIYVRFVQVFFMIFATCAGLGVLMAPFRIEDGGDAFRYFFFGSLILAVLTGSLEASLRTWYERMYRLRVMDERTNMRRAELHCTDETLTPVGLVDTEFGRYDLL